MQNVRQTETSPFMHITKNNSMLLTPLYFHSKMLLCYAVWFGFMKFNATSNNIPVISWRSVLLVEETGVPGDNHRPAVSHWQTLSHNVVSSTPCLRGIRTHNVSGDRYWLLSSRISLQNQLFCLCRLPAVILENYVASDWWFPPILWAQ
jgi:hypothetical protein